MNFTNFMGSKFSKIISVTLIVFIFACYASSCGEEISTADFGEYLNETLLDYRNNGMNCWQDVLAVYNADHNPLDYKNFDETLVLYDQNNYENMIGYCLIVDAALIIGADEAYFENFQPYLKKLRALVEKTDGGEEVTTDMYARAYYALRGANISFDSAKFIEYIASNQQQNGGYADSAETTATLIPAIVDLAKNNPDNQEIKNCLDNAVQFVEGARNGDNTFSNERGKSAVATSIALQSLISYYCYYGNSPDIAIINDVYESLTMFKTKKNIGYSDLANKTSEPDMHATAYAIMAISSMSGKMSMWDKFILEAAEVEPAIE